MKNIFLIGMPSSGKSTLGRRLADALHYRFVDTDRLIVRAEGRSINEIFADAGEAYFREVEARALRSIRPGGSAVVATGGGMPAFHDNMAYIRATGVSVFLDVPLPVLHQRMLAHVADRANDRPLFDPAQTDLLDQLAQKYDIRRPFYQQADITVSGETSVDELLRQLGNWL